MLHKGHNSTEHSDYIMKKVFHWGLEQMSVIKSYTSKRTIRSGTAERTVLSMC